MRQGRRGDRPGWWDCSRPRRHEDHRTVPRPWRAAATMPRSRRPAGPARRWPSRSAWPRPSPLATSSHPTKSAISRGPRVATFQVSKLFGSSCHFLDRALDQLLVLGSVKRFPDHLLGRRNHQAGDLIARRLDRTLALGLDITSGALDKALVLGFGLLA